MKSLSIKSLGAACLLTLGAAVPSAAATFDVLKQRNSLMHDGNQSTSVSGQINTLRGKKQKVLNTSAGSFHLKGRAGGSSDPYQDFIAFCIESTQSISVSTKKVRSYEVNNTFFGAERRSLMATLLGTAFDPAKTATHHAATQLAVWKLAYGDISSPSGDAFDLSANSALYAGQNGYLNLMTAPNGKPLSKPFEKKAPGVFALAQSFLDKLDGQGNDDWARLSDNGLTILTSGKSQNLVTYQPSPNPTPAPVPVPAAGVLLVGAIGGLSLLKRKS